MISVCINFPTEINECFDWIIDRFAEKGTVHEVQGYGRTLVYFEADYDETVYLSWIFKNIEKYTNIDAGIDMFK